MYSFSSVVNTISYSDANISYADFLESHNQNHQKNVYCAKNSQKLNYCLNTSILEDKHISQDGGHNNNNMKIIDQYSNKGRKYKPRRNIKKIKNDSSDNETKLNNGTIQYTLKYSFKRNLKYPFQKIISHLIHKFNNKFKKSLDYNSFIVKHITIKGCSKKYQLINIMVDVGYHNIRNHDIVNLGNKFEKYPINDDNIQVNFSLQNYKM